jgi:hypothetical protein
MNFSMNLKSTSCPITINAEELLNEMKQDKETEKWRGDLNSKTRETSTMWKILSLIRTTDQTQEEDSHPGAGEGEEDPRNSQTTTQEIHTSTASIREVVIVPKGAQKPRRILLEFSKRRQWWVLPPQCQPSFARTSGSHSLWILNEVQS